ncbi:MAG: hypothetical protein ACLQD9_05875 [Thermoplasmata archaeon]
MATQYPDHPSGLVVIFDLRGIKRAASLHLPPESPTRDLILAAPDFLAASSFVERASDWLLLLSHEARHQ